MKDKNAEGEFSEEETARRRDEAIRRALNTPHKPQSEMIGKSARSPRKRPPTASDKRKKPSKRD